MNQSKSLFDQSKSNPHYESWKPGELGAAQLAFCETDGVCVLVQNDQEIFLSADLITYLHKRLKVKKSIPDKVTAAERNSFRKQQGSKGVSSMNDISKAIKQF